MIWHLLLLCIPEPPPWAGVSVWYGGDRYVFAREERME
jgi:hypothetical protein